MPEDAAAEPTTEELAIGAKLAEIYVLAEEVQASCPVGSLGQMTTDIVLTALTAALRSDGDPDGFPVRDLWRKVAGWAGSQPNGPVPGVTVTKSNRLNAN